MFFSASVSAQHHLKIVAKDTKITLLISRSNKDMIVGMVNNREDMDSLKEDMEDMDNLKEDMGNLKEGSAFKPVLGTEDMEILHRTLGLITN